LLNILRDIVQEVNEAQDFKEVLYIIVGRVSKTINVEACSIYLTDRRRNHYLMTASVGFLPGVDCNVSLGFSEGLIGLVGEREEPINVSDAPTHPRYRYFPETGEERYRAFLGVPIIHQRKLVGIIAVQQREPRRFDEGEEAFLVTISAQLSGIIAHAQMAGSFFERDSQDLLNTAFRGVPSAPGVGVGKGFIIYELFNLEAVPNKPVEDTKKEQQRFIDALSQTRANITKLKNRVEGTLSPDELSLFDAYISILDGSTLKEGVLALIKEGHWAPWALRKVIKRQVRKFDNMEDMYLRERTSDLLDLGRRILANLQNKKLLETKIPKDAIVIAENLLPSLLAELPEGHLQGVISTKGSANSHVAIIARAMGVPAVMGVSGLPINQLEDKKIIVDGYNGEIYTTPSRGMIKEFTRLAQEEKELYAGLDELRELRAQTPDDKRVGLWVNTGLVADFRAANQVGAEGVGLYRSEVPFMIRDRFPGEEEQYLIYRQLLESFAPKPVTIRTLDAGGDKHLPYLPVDEDNPSLGWRGIRITLDHPEIFLVQLRAMLRANHNLNNLRVLFPMISSISEVEESLRLLKQAYREVTDEGINAKFPLTGVMIEVPSAVYQAQELIKFVDFLSVGSNDLIQYMLAVDRNNANVSNMFDSLHPAVIQALKIIVEKSHDAGKPVSICGEMAGDPMAVVLLLGLGFDVLSMSSHSLPKVKWVIRNFTLSKAQQVVKEVLTMHHAREIRKHLEKALEEAGLGGLVRAGK
jgi:phosphotransferase system enzyme I (PtsP)